MSTVKSAARVLDILELLASSGRAMTHAEIGRRTAIPKSSLTQLLRNLAERGYVEPVEDSLAFRTGYFSRALLHKPESGRIDPNPGRSYAMAATGTVVGRPSCVKRLSTATRTCNSTT